MLFESLRIIKDKSATLTDLSLDLQERGSTSVVDLTTNDFLYLGSYFPFNNVFFEVDTANEQDASFIVEYWDGGKWTKAVDILDSTKQDGKPLARSGHVMFAQDRDDYSLLRVDETDEENGLGNLETLTINDLYWYRLSVDSSLSATASLRRMGFAFTSDEKLRAVRSEVDRYIETFKRYETGKDSWTTEIMQASKEVLIELKKMGAVRSWEQVIAFDDIWLPTTYKALEIIYSQLGTSFEETRKLYSHKFHKTLNVKNMTVDSNETGRRTVAKQASRIYTGVR